MKTRQGIIALLLVTCLLATSFFGVCLVNGTYYYNINWGHLKRDDPNAYEAWEENYRCYAITNLFNYQTGWDSWNAYGSLSNKSNLQSTIVWRQQNDVFATDFWVGDFYPNPIQGQYWTEGWYWDVIYLEEPFPAWWPVYVYGWHWEPGGYVFHQSYYGSGIDATQDINDTNLYSWTNYPYSKQKFTFSWTCSCAQQYESAPYYGYNDQQYYTGIVGMPLAWTSNWDMNTDGYSYPNTAYCYIGFDGPSHPLIDLVNGTNYHYTDFPRAFYEKLLGFDDNGVHQTVKASLDHACETIWQTSWDDSPFSAYGDGYYIYVAPPPGVPPDPPYGDYYVHMQVIGNSSLIMPYG